MREGKGINYFKNGNIYFGDYSKNNFEGYGIYIF